MNQSDIVNSLKILCNNCINEGYTTAPEAKQYLESLQPNFKQDEIFQQVFKIVFNMTLCELARSE